MFNETEEQRQERIRRERIASKLGSIIRYWDHRGKSKGVCSLDELSDEEAVTLGLKGHYQSVTFKKMKDPALMRLYSSNWKCEYEINGVYDVGLARALYREMVAAGAEVRDYKAEQAERERRERLQDHAEDLAGM